MNGHRVYDLMRRLNPDIFVHTGDMVYYDRAMPYATTVRLARFHWKGIYALPFGRAFHNEVTSYFLKDDHDTLKDDCWPGQHYGALTWSDGLALVREQALVGPDRAKKGDSHANAAFATEGRELREFMAAQKNILVINGDRHWQYASVDAVTVERVDGRARAVFRHYGTNGEINHEDVVVAR